MDGQSDLNDKITRLLSSPDGLEKIRAAMTALGGEIPASPVSAPAAPAAPPAPAPAASPAAVLSSLAPAAGLPDAATLAKLLPLVGALGKEDDDTRLLHALRPYLHGEREARLEETVRLLRLVKLLPLLQETGILGKKHDGGI